MKRQRGQSVVEFALIAPIVFMMIFGLIWSGIMFMEYMHYSNAIRTVTRDIAVSATTNENRQQLLDSKKKWLLDLWKNEVRIPFYQPVEATIKDDEDNESTIPVIQETDTEVIVTIAFTMPDETYASLPRILTEWIHFPPKTIRTMQYTMVREKS